MNKQDNPYYNIVQMIKSDNNTTKESFAIGTVVNNNPLLVSLNGIQLDRQDFKINAMLVDSIKANIKANEVSLTDKNTNSVSYYINSNLEGTIDIESYFNTGDKVLMLVSQNQQNIVLLCKVV